MYFILPGETTMGVRTKTINFFRKLLPNNQASKLLTHWEKLYGEFDKNNYGEFSVDNLPSESGFYHGEIIKWSADIKPESVLFVGENLKTAVALKEKMNAVEVYTTGLSDVDYLWNFEEDVPAIEKNFDLIISQAILEHLLNPYKHFNDMNRLVNNRGHIIIHSVMPGFNYHRYPIDAVRFFPDWFEEVSKRFKLKIVKKRIRDTHIFYMYQKI